MIERCVVEALAYVAAHPDVIAEAMAVFQQQQAKALPEGQAELRREKSALDAALTQIGQDEAAVIQAQIAGIRAGASPDAYAAVFADIAAQRKDMKDRRGSIMRRLTGPKPGKKALPLEPPTFERKALEEPCLVLSSAAVTGHAKRDIVATVIDHVVCQPDGAEVFFLPGVGTEHLPGYRLQASAGVSDTFNPTLTELIQ